MEIIIILIVLLILVITIYFISQNKKLKKIFEIHNVSIFGAKGKGKDLITQLVINLRKEPYLSNIDYGGLYHHIDVADLNIDPNTYDNFINGNIATIKKNELYEGMDVYFSDLGTTLPSQYDFVLDKKYKSFPIYYALSRHLYSQNIHYNSQALSRVWKKIREQADYYILCRGVLHLPFFKVIKITIYDNYQSAELKYQPTKKRLFNKFSKAENDLYNSTNGTIKNLNVFIWNKNIHYDTRAYHQIIFENRAPSTREKKQIKKISKLWK